MQIRKIGLSIFLALACLGLAGMFGAFGLSFGGVRHASSVSLCFFYSPMIVSSNLNFPFFGGLLIWFLLGLLAPWCEKQFIWNSMIVLLLVSYAGTLWDVRADMKDGDSFAYIRSGYTPVVLSGYIFLQLSAIGWLLHARKRRALAMSRG